MDIRYYHDFVGDDNVLNRFELLTKDAEAMQVEASPQPFVLEYVEAKKLEPVRGSQATIELICNKIFQFVDLHTDDMQKYLVKFYRSGSLYWLGWLDAELYNEQLSDVPPYKVSFTASDFNILERLKYLDNSEKQFSDIVPLITHLKRCFDKLALPFNKLYIGCSTSANDITVTSAETALHVLHVMSSNFYDEDNEPMTCREVVESILQPFGLMMVQKGANVYIYDYNTVKLSLPMKRYDFSTFNYEADETVNFNLGNLADIGFMSTDSSYGFEEMVNNVTITSSLYADKDLYKCEITRDTLSDLIGLGGDKNYSLSIFGEDKNVERISGKGFVVYTDLESDKTIVGMSSPYDNLLDDSGKEDFSKKLYRISSKTPLISTEKSNIVLKMECFVSGSDNPFDSVDLDNADSGSEDDNSAELCTLVGNLYTVDENGTPLYYYISRSNKPGWRTCALDFSKGRMELYFCNQNTKNSSIYNNWLTNSNIGYTPYAWDSVKQKNYGKGLIIPINSNIHGQIIFEIIGVRVQRRLRASSGSGNTDIFILNGGRIVKDIIYNNIEIKVVNEKGEDISTDDYEFKSYVNKKVASDFDDVTLKCISANEEKAPIGKANILKKVDNHYELQLSYTRNGQTEILERLLMRTIHSNYTTKNEKISVEVKMTENPALNFVSYEPILSDKYLVTGCTLDFHSGKTTLSAVGYSADVANLSSIPYD